MGWEPIAIATAVALFGLLAISVIASAKRDEREEAERQKFYKAVEEARQEQIDGGTQDRNISGVWKGEGTGFFGVGRRIEFRFNHSGSSVSGQLKDDFGEAMLAGYFVCPYILFDVRRDDTSFEFRGTVLESGGTRSIQGKYRYSTTDADWLVKEVASGQAVSADSRKSITSVEPSQEPIEQKPVEEPKQESRPPVAEQSRTAEELDVVPRDPGKLDSPGVKTGSNDCPECHKPLDANFEFCLYCGQR
jgi:hypothetical protein